MNLLRRFAVVAIAVMGFIGSAGMAGLRVNTTHSVEPGLYWLHHSEATTGATVWVCPPNNAIIAEAYRRGYFGAGFCPGGYEHLFKRVLAAKNDVVSIAPEGITVNHEAIPNTAQVSVDPAGRSLPIQRADALKLGNDDVLLIANHSEQSFDARYFGPVNRSLIHGVVTPIFTW